MAQVVIGFMALTVLLALMPPLAAPISDSIWLFDLRPNHDPAGRMRFPGHPQVGWTLFAKPFRETGPGQDLAEAQAFFDALVAALGFPAQVLHRYAQGEERL